MDIVYIFPVLVFLPIKIWQPCTLVKEQITKMQFEFFAEFEI
jgi:hypothetical protein